MRLNGKEVLTPTPEVQASPEPPVEDLVWYKPLILDNGKLDDTKTTSEYERGFIDCWNELWKYSYV